MTHIVGESCINCKFTDCVEVCPVDCFHEGVNMLVIDPEVCIDCGLCIPECPVEAIVTEDDLPEEWADYLEINAKYAAEWPVIDAQKEPLACAEEHREIKDKKDMLDPSAFSG
ncbi:MAG: ferredoxin FdxA [Phycisphaerae bacterium]